jgi:integrase
MFQARQLRTRIPSKSGDELPDELPEPVGETSLGALVLRGAVDRGTVSSGASSIRQPVGLHHLRHSYVALALASGSTLAETAALARHANARVTAQVYAALTNKGREQTAAKLVTCTSDTSCICCLTSRDQSARGPRPPPQFMRQR